MLEHNKRMQTFLRQSGIEAIPKYIFTGSLRGCWRLYGKTGKGKGFPLNERYQKWSPELQEKLNSLGFRNLDGGPLGRFDGNGGLFSVFVRGHDEFLK